MKSDHETTGKLYTKIDIHYREAGGWRYACSTNWWRTLRDARQNWADIHLSGQTHDSKGRPQVRAVFDRRPR